MLKHFNQVPMAPKRVVVLGSQGFVGSHIVERLKKDGIPNLGISKTQVNLLEEGASLKLSEHLEAGDALVIVSAIAPCKNNAQLIDNLRMMQNILNAVQQINLSQIIYISSDAVYADDANPVIEASPASPTTLHGLMHRARELMLTTTITTTPITILRPSLLYGLQDPHNGYGPNRFRRLAEANTPITLFGEGEEKRDHIYIQDVAAIVSLSLSHRSEGVLNIATGKSLSFRDIAEMIVEKTGKKIEIKGTPRQNPVTHRHFDITACYKAFPQFQYRDFEAGLRAMSQNTEVA